jgi:hypothetical protein
VARLAVAVLTAARAKSLAVWLAQRLHRQGQKYLLPKHIFKPQTVLLIIPDFCLRRSNRPFRGLGIGSRGAEDQVEFRTEGNFDGFYAARAGNLKLAGKLPPEADVGDNISGTAVLVEHLSPPG